MCSIFKYKQFMGRNYDYELSYDEQAILIPKYSVHNNRFDILGIGSGLFSDYPMMYDAMNTEGVAMGGLAFSENAVYHEEIFDGRTNIAPWQMIPAIIGNYESVKAFKDDATRLGWNVIDERFNKQTDNAELHWFMCDRKESIVIESTEHGTDVYDNPYNALTNNPPFPEMVDSYWEHVHHIGKIPVHYTTRGKNTFGLSGGYTSMERFEKLVYLKEHVERYNVMNPLNDAFKLLQSVEQLYGCTPVGKGYEYTIYKAVYDLEDGKLHTWKYNDMERKSFSFKDAESIVRMEL